MTSGLRASTGVLLQIFVAIEHFTGGAGNAERRERLAVQFQQHGAGIGSRNFELVGGREMVVFAGLEGLIEERLAVGEDGEVDGSAGGDGEVERNGGSRGQGVRRR